MGFVAWLALAVGALLAYSARKGVRPWRVLSALVRGEPLPTTPDYPIETAGTGAAGSAIGEAAGRLSGAIGTMTRPVAGGVISPFGPRGGRMHEGVDLAAAEGTPIHAALAGEATAVGYAGTAGNRIRLRHSSSLETVYMHLSRFAVHAGQRVDQGQIIGYVGRTGNASGPHLHFEVRVNGRPVDPLKGWISR